MIIVSIPAYNEEKTIVPVLKDIKRVMAGQNYKILVLNDGSKDKTKKVASKK